MAADDRPRSFPATVAFTFMWGQLQAAHVAKDLSWGRWPLVPVLAGLLMLPAVVQPWARWALPLAAASSLGYLLNHGSRSNHIMVDIFVNLAIVVSSATAPRAAGRRQFDRLARVLHWQLFALYFAAAVHKLNTDWFDVRVSCASSVMGMLLAQYVPSLVPATSMVATFLLNSAPYGALVLEFLLPLLLVLAGAPSSAGDATWFQASCRRGVVVLAALFHLGLALPLPPSSFYPFSAACLVLYLLQVPEALQRVEAALRCVDRRLSSVGLWWWWWWLLPTYLALFAEVHCQARFSQWLRGEAPGAAAPFEYPPYDLYDVGISWTAGLTLLLVAFAAWPGCRDRSLQTLARGDGGTESVASDGPPQQKPAYGGGGCVATFITLLCGVVVLLVGLAPYLGLRTYPAFAMFSNLRVEGAPNHLLVPDGGVDLFGFQRDTVRVLDTNSPAVRSLQVDLAILYTASTTSYMEEAGLQPALWICPPAWRHPPPANFTPFSVPALELRRRLLREAAPHGHYFVRIVREGHEVVLHSAADLHIGCPSWAGSGWLCEALQWAVGPYRSFDEASSPCRH